MRAALYLRSVQVFLFRSRNDTIETHQWHLCLSGNFSLGSRRHGIKRRWIFSGFAESVQHLLIERHLANDELVSVRLDLFCLISKFLEQSTVLRRQVICVWRIVVDTCSSVTMLHKQVGKETDSLLPRDLGRDVGKDTELFSRHHVILELQGSTLACQTSQTNQDSRPFFRSAETCCCRQ